MGYELVGPSGQNDWAAYHDIRRQELFEAKGRFGIYNVDHPDEFAPGNHPYLLKLDGLPIGTTRLDVRDDGIAIVRMVAITAAEQGKGHGRTLGQLVEARARAFGSSILYVNAAETAVGFYHNTGWQNHVWDASELVGIAVNAVQMRKLL